MTHGPIAASRITSVGTLLGGCFGPMKPEHGFNEDFLDMLRAMVDASVEFVVVGAHALAVHGVPRATGDIDLFVRPTQANAARVMSALHEFGAPVEAHGVRETDFEVEGTVYQIGLPPRRIDILTQISGVSFEEAWRSRVAVKLDGREVGFLGKDALLANKRATGRDKDQVDIRLLEHQTKPVC